MEDLKGNPDITNNPNSSIKPIATNATVVKNGSETKKFGKRFFSEDAKTVGSHVLDSVVIPSLQKLISDAVKGAIDWLIYGSKGSRTQNGPGNISYGNYYTRSGVVNSTPVYTSPMLTAKPTLYAVNDICIPDRGQAEEILLRLREAINVYGMVSVREFYELAGVPFNFTDQKWGWFDLKMADIIRGDNGFYIRFPKVQPIEK